MKIISLLIPIAILVLALGIVGCQKGVLSAPSIDDNTPDTSNVDDVDVSDATGSLDSTTSIGQLESPTLDEELPDTSSIDDIAIDTSVLS